MIVDISIGMKPWLGRQATASFATGSVIRRRAVIFIYPGTPVDISAFISVSFTESSVLQLHSLPLLISNTVSQRPAYALS